MNIRKKVVLVVCLVFFTLSVAAVLISYFVLLDGVKEVEKNQVKTDIINTESAFNNYLANMSVKLVDWASWDDSYKFIQDNNSEYVESNLAPQSLKQINIDLMIFVDQKGQIIKSVAIAQDQMKEIPFPNSFIVYLQKNKDKILAKKSDSRNEGIIVLPEGALMFASRPILKSNGEGPVLGTLIFGAFFNDKMVDYLSSLTHLDTRAYVYSQENIPQDFESAKAGLAVNPYFINPRNSSIIAGYLLLKDESGRPGLIIRMDMSRDVYKQGMQSAVTMCLVIIFIIIIMGIAFYILLERLVISRITEISSRVSEIRDKKDPGLRLAFSENNDDEISGLAKNINSMIDELSAAKIQESAERGQLEAKIKEFTDENAKLENSQKAIINVLEDTKGLEEELKVEKENVEKKIIERTRQLADEQARLQASISSLPIGFAMTDMNENIVTMNGIAKSVLCIKSGSNFSGAITKENLKHFDCDLNEIRERLKGSFDLKLAIEKVINERKPFEVKELAIDDLFLHIFIAPITIIQGKEFLVIGSVMLVENITEQKILERSKDEFFSIASHELRTPLTAIRGNTSMILDYYADQLKDPQMKEMVDDVHESSIRLIEIVNDFLNTSRLELGKMEFKKDVIDLSTLIPLVIKEYQVTGSRQKLYINFEPDDKIPSVTADSDRLRQVIINLVGNGMKFTEKGGITISLKLDGDFVKVLVSDTGMGISRNSQNLLFRKFQQAENNIFTRDTTKGTGLGLYVSKMMVEGMGGRIRLEGSEIGKGTTFSFTLPVVK
jgi:signal transduction histidine kinase/sensor domain CHASE-containing protein